MHGYDSFFEIRPGRRVYVQSKWARAIGRKLVGEALCLYQPADIFYHWWMPSGHVAALRLHASSSFLSRFDIDGFFGRVTRSRIRRSLRRIGFDWRTAFDCAYASVVVKDGVKSLPFGFVQSPFLATMVLEHSALGGLLKSLSRDLLVSVYVDDILISGNDRRVVLDASKQIAEVAAASKFPLSAGKSELAQTEVTAFNCRLGSGKLSITEERMRAFVAAYPSKSQVGQWAIANYICAISLSDYTRFIAALGYPSWTAAHA